MDDKEEMTLNDLEHINGVKNDEVMKIIIECPVCHCHISVDLNASVVYCKTGHKIELKG